MLELSLKLLEMKTNVEIDEFLLFPALKGRW